MRLDLAHVATRLFETPLLIHRGRLDVIMQTFGPRIAFGSATGRSMDSAAFAAGVAERNAMVGASGQTFDAHGYDAGAGVGVLQIVGTLVRRSSWLDAECGLTSYAAIGETLDHMLEAPSIRGVILEIDTPGGEAGGCFDLARHIRRAAADAGKPVWAHVNELAASAGYALASSAETIWVPTTGEVGSIGVVASHVDVSGADAKAGLKWSLIAAGEHKVDGNSHEPLSDRARASIQADVTTLYDMFVGLVAEHRPRLSAARIKATEANVYRGALSLEAGLADRLGTFDEALTAFATHLNATSEAGAHRKPRANRPPSEAERAAAAHAVAAEQDRAMALIGLEAMASRLGVAFDADGAIRSGVNISAARRAVMDQAAVRDEAIEINAYSQSHRDPERDVRNAWAKALKGSSSASARSSAGGRQAMPID